MKVTQTTVVFQSFSRLFSGISRTIFSDLNGKNSWSTTQAITIMISTYGIMRMDQPPKVTS